MNSSTVPMSLVVVKLLLVLSQNRNLRSWTKTKRHPGRLVLYAVSDKALQGTASEMYLSFGMGRVSSGCSTVRILGWAWLHEIVQGQV